MPVVNPPFYQPAPIVLSSFGGETAGLLARLLSTTGFASQAWGTSGLCILIPYELSEDMPIARCGVYLGAANTGNVDLGVYSDSYVRLGSTGSTALGTVSELQEIALSVTAPRGRGYIGLGLDNTAGTVQSMVTVADRARMAGFAQQATFPLPNPFVPAAYAQTLWPLFAFTRRTFF